MKIKLDENLPESLVAELATLNHDADTVPQEGLAGHDDPDVWAAAQAAGRFLITQDLDFSDVRKSIPHRSYVHSRTPSFHRQHSQGDLADVVSVSHATVAGR